jgi:hypothetical protein
VFGSGFAGLGVRLISKTRRILQLLANQLSENSRLPGESNVLLSGARLYARPLELELGKRRAPTMCLLLDATITLADVTVRTERL